MANPNLKAKNPKVQTQITRILAEFPTADVDRKAQIASTLYGYGLNPYQYDPRFNFRPMPEFRGQKSTPERQFIETATGDSQEINPYARPWVDLDPTTQRNDLWSITIAGKPGTSEGDYWAPNDIQAAKRIVGNAEQITPQHIEQFKVYLLQRKDPHFMSTHPGKQPFTPENTKVEKQISSLMNTMGLSHEAAQEVLTNG